MLECVVNVSEGRDQAAIQALVAASGRDLLDIHRDPHHHRSVFTLVGEEAPRRLATAAITALDLSDHDGVHPRLGIVDVVPFVPLEASTMADAVAARDGFAAWLAREHDVPVFLYGSERTLPEVRRQAFRELLPDLGPARPHPTAGASCVGARPVLIAYNVWVAGMSLDATRAIARAIRRPGLRTLGLAVGAQTQVSMNLVEPTSIGPAQAYDLVAGQVRTAGSSVARAELVGLLPAAVLAATPRDRWAELDLDADRTIEARLPAGG